MLQLSQSTPATFILKKFKAFLMNNLFGIIGWSGSGKTDLICRIIKTSPKKKIRICSVKHSHHNFQIDKEGKDSFKHLQSGSKEVLIFNEYKFAMISRKKKEKIFLKDIVKKFSKNVDIILVEGMKFSTINKIEVYRTTINKPLLCLKDKNIKALVYDKVSEEIENLDLPMFQFKETSKISSFILKKTQKNEKI